MRIAGSIAAMAARASSMKAARREGGSDRSWLLIAPTRRLASGIDLADGPEAVALGAALREQGVGDEALLHGGGEGVLEAALEVGAEAVGGLGEDAPRGAHVGGQRNLGHGLGQEGDALHVDELEGGEGTAERVAHQAEERQRGGRRGHGDPRGRGLAGRGEQAQAGGGDDGEGAFGADDQVAEVIPHVVLHQAPHALEDAAVGHHRLDAEAEVAGIAVAQHADPAGIGAEQAADAGRALGGERQREEAPGVAGGGLDVGEDAAGLGDEKVVGEVEVADAVQPLDGEQDRQRAVLEDLAADEAGAAGVGDDADAGFGAEADGGRHGLRRRGPEDGGGAAVEAAAGLLEVARLGGADGVGAEGEGQALEERGIGGKERRGAKAVVGQGVGPQGCQALAWSRRSSRRLA